MNSLPPEINESNSMLVPRIHFDSSGSFIPPGTFLSPRLPVGNIFFSSLMAHLFSVWKSITDVHESTPSHCFDNFTYSDQKNPKNVPSKIVPHPKILMTLCACAYTAIEEDKGKNLPDGFKYINFVEFLKNRGKFDMIVEDIRDGPDSTLYYHTEKNLYVFVTRGSMIFADWFNNVLQEVGLAPHYQHNAAVAIALNDAIGSEAHLVFTGHSKGGGHATLNSLVTGCYGIAFNTAPLDYDTIDEVQIALRLRGCEKNVRRITSYRVQNDPLRAATLINPRLIGSKTYFIGLNPSDVRQVLENNFLENHILENLEDFLKNHSAAAVIALLTALGDMDGMLPIRCGNTEDERDHVRPVRIKNVRTGKYLAFGRYAVTNSPIVQKDDMQRDVSQQWILQEGLDGYSRLFAVEDQRFVLSVWGDSADTNRQAVLQLDDDDRAWGLTQIVTGGTFIIKNKISNKVLDGSNTAVIQSDYCSIDSQHWVIIDQ